MGAFVPFLVAFVLLCPRCLCHATVDQKTTYIVHMAKHRMPPSFEHHLHWYHASLRAASSSAEFIYTYEDVIHGFSARLTAEEARSLGRDPAVLAVIPELRYELQTTRTPAFLGLDSISDQSSLCNSSSRIIIGVLDSGVWPESKSFADAGYDPVPSGWKGKCQAGAKFTKKHCNRKLIGARYFSKGYEAAASQVMQNRESKSPRDDNGHGTHTASTAAGSPVGGANLLGYANGTAQGVAACARIAVYKVCWADGCFASDILAGMDRAVKDGVNVISISLGASIDEYTYDMDAIAVGAFTAMEKGITVSAPAGNYGPTSSSLVNEAPWITTVGVGTLDRDFPAYVYLSNGQNYSGVSLYRGEPLPGTTVPIIYAGNASGKGGGWCLKGSLNKKLVKGKIVVCDRGRNARAEKAEAVMAAGGLGMVLVNDAEDGEDLLPDAFVQPSLSVGYKSGNAIKTYLLQNRTPTASMEFAGTRLGVQPSPVVARFSSRGPSSVASEIIKPDVIAPGVDILAGWPGSVPPTELKADPRRVEFNILSGTSMACPHVSGAAALLKGAHPEWSPAAIRSALMTTAYSTYPNGETLRVGATAQSASPFDLGSGHIKPAAALDPGLVYDLAPDDYVLFLCSLKYTTQQIKIITKRDVSCGGGDDEYSDAFSAGNLNYPSLGAVFAARETGVGRTTLNYSRTVTNVGSPGTYHVSVWSKSPAVKITVVPTSLSFTQANEKKTYTVTLEAFPMPSNTYSFARLEWADGKHFVASPLAFIWKK